ncbi:unnamed protein product, partial [Sphagnum tenellum]
MRVSGVYDVSMVIQGRTMTCPVVVSPDLGAEMIIGSNLIRKEGMSLNPWEDRIDFIPKPIPTVQPDWTTAAIQLKHAVSIEALDARLCECALVHSDGSKVGAFVDFYGLQDGEPIAAKTDAKGLVQLCTTVTHNIHLRDKEPTYTKQFPLPHEELDIIRSNLREWLK